MKNYYACLGLDPNKNHTPRDIKDAWHIKCIEHHPDKGGDSEKFREVTHAYKMITSPQYRKEDKESKPATSNLDLRIQMGVSFDDAFFGKSFNISYGVNKIGEDGFILPIKELIDTETITVKVVAGTQSGADHLFPKKGLISSVTKERGDTCITISVKPSKKFQLNGNDVIATELVPLEVMLKGGKITVQTMYGLKDVKVRPGTQPDQKLQVRNCGVNEVGDHIVIVKPDYPDKDKLKKDKAWRGLDIDWRDDDEGDEVHDSRESDFLKMFAKLNNVNF